MAHKRKISNEITKKTIEETKKKEHVTTLSEEDGKRLQELVNLNNTYAALLKQYTQYGFAIESLKKKIQQIKDGEITLPLIIQFAPKVSYAENNKEKVFKGLNDELNGLRVAKSSIESQLQHRMDEFVESMIRVYRLLEIKIGDGTLKNISGLRALSGNSDTQIKNIEEEKVLLEKEFDSLSKEDEKEIKQLLQTVKKENSKNKGD